MKTFGATEAWYTYQKRRLQTQYRNTKEADIATLQITIPDALLPRVLDSFAATYKYNAATDGTKAQFTRKKLAEYVRGVVQSYEVQKATELAAQTAADQGTVELGGIG